jgi:polyprenyl P-hydroxybenzoate/phenylacrylic acid decarboxylase-like protein
MWAGRPRQLELEVFSPAPPSGLATGAAAPTAPDAPPDEAAVLAAWRAPLHIRPDDLARRALAGAAHALKTGEGLNAVRLARAATEIARLNDVLNWADEDPADTEERFEAGQAMMRMFLRERALTLAQETGLSVSDVNAKADVVHRAADVGASIASGSFRTLGMLIAPCSVRTMSEIATGVTSSLMTRAADVVLKERRTLVLMVRETPFHLGHLRTMTSQHIIVGLVSPASFLILQSSHCIQGCS